MKVETEILYHLWAEGAVSLSKLLKHLPFSDHQIISSLEDLIKRRYIYKLFDPPDKNCVYYLTSDTYNKLSKDFQSNPRYRLKKLWYGLKSEETKLPLFPGGQID